MKNILSILLTLLMMVGLVFLIKANKEFIDREKPFAKISGMEENEN